MTTDVSTYIFNEDALDVITNTPLFNEEEKQEFRKASENMEKAFQNSQVFRTDTEMRISVLNDIKFPTEASKYYQALREMNAHQCELVGLLYDYELKKEDLNILQAEKLELEHQLKQCEIDNLPSYEILKLNAYRNQKDIHIRQETFNLKSIKRVADGRKDEIKNWNKILNELEPILHKLNIPTDNVDSHQKISYCIRFIRQTMNAMATKANMSGSEVNNLLGQLQTNLKVIQQQNLISAVAVYLTNAEKTFLTSNKLLTTNQSNDQSGIRLVEETPPSPDNNII